MSTDTKRISWFWINIGIFISLIIAINSAATQYVASRLGYDEALGQPIFGDIYNPFAWFPWAVEFTRIDGNNAYGEFFKWVYVSVAGGLILTLLIFGVGRLIFARKAQAYKDVHGSAHFADKKEIEDMGLIDQPKGAYIGAWKDPKKGTVKYLRHNGPEHILAFAPTRSGKGVGLVLPTLLAWEGSTVVLDIKGENWELTSGWRQKYANNKVLKFDPVGEAGGAKYNPLEEIRMDSIYTVSDAQNIASIIIDPDGKGLEDHWAKTGYALLTTMILHLIHQANKEGFIPTLSQLRGVLNDPSKGDVKEILDEIINYGHVQGENGEWMPHPVIAVGAKEAMNKPDNELGSVVSTVVSNLSLYDDPVVARNIASSDFKISELMKHENPVSLYLVIKPSDMNRLRPLVRIILNQILTLLVGDMKFENGQQKIEYNHRLLLMLDEFTSIGKLPLFETALAYMAGYGIKAYMIVQDLSQLYKAYTKDESVISNSHVRIAYAPNKIETAELLSKMTGQTTVVKTVRTSSGNRGSLVLSNVSENYQEVQRPLLTTDKCMTLPGAKKSSDGKVKEAGDMLIFVAGNPVIYGKQILYFLDPVFSKRAKVPSPKISDSLV